MTEFEAMLLSAAIEAPVAGLAAWLTRWPSRGPLHVAGAATVATFVSHPLLWQAVLWGYDHASVWAAVALPEALVTLGEGALIAWIARMRLPQAMLVSLLANAASLLAGLLLQG